MYFYPFVCCEAERPLKGFFHPACFVRVVSLFASVAAIFMVHENGDEQKKPRDDTCKECWMKETL